MRFTKLHGLGNDYIFVDAAKQPVADPRKLAVEISDRHFGVGSDGLILILPSDKAHVRMRMFNADGSEAEMCGNGIRCVAKYSYEKGLAREQRMKVETGAGVLTLELDVVENIVHRVRVDMGEPRLSPEQVPVSIQGFEGDRVLNHPVTLDGQEYRMTCVSMGNPHAVFFVDDVDEIEIERLGPKVELHPMFPRRTNVHFVEMNSAGEVTVKTWERGSGVTLACGTGACAVCVAGVLTKTTTRRLITHLPGGDLELEWSEADNHVYMTGPATEVFSGDWPDAK
jgi:diaminopimelate epimerase